jgi:hypothetical protein
VGSDQLVVRRQPPLQRIADCGHGRAIPAHPPSRNYHSRRRIDVSEPLGVDRADGPVSAAYDDEPSTAGRGPSRHDDMHGQLIDRDAS